MTMRYHEFFKKILLLFGILVLESISASGAEVEPEHSFMVSQDSYILANLYNDVIYLDEDDSVAGTISSSFYHGGYIYIFQNFQLCAFPLPSGPEKVVAQPVSIENYSEGVNHAFRFYYFGTTDSGQPFAASYVHSKPGQQSNPFEIFQLDFSKGWQVATVVRHWELPLGTDSEWGPHNPQITGDLTTGNFIVAAQVWEHSAYNSRLSESEYTTKIALWQVQDNAVSAPQWGRAVLSPSVVTPLGDNKVLLHDKQHWSNITPKFTYSSLPQIVEITDNHQLKTITTLSGSCSQLDKYSCGAVLFKSGDNHLMLYHTGIGDDGVVEDDEDAPEIKSDKLGIAFLPDGAENLSTAVELTTMMPLDNVSTSSIRSNESGVSQLSAIPIDDNRTLLLSIPYSHHNVLGVYTLDRQDIPTSLDDITSTSNDPVEYFTLQGQKIQRPQTPGIYLRRQSNQVTKVLIK